MACNAGFDNGWAGLMHFFLVRYLLSTRGTFSGNRANLLHLNGDLYSMAQGQQVPWSIF